MNPEPEIGSAVITNDEITVVEKNLKDSPPQPFDLARKVRVFTSFIDFVELNLHNCDLNRHTISLPREIQLLASKDQALHGRLKAQFKLIDDKDVSDIGLDGITGRVKEVRKNYLVNLQDLGSVVLKKKQQ